jgi:hypothetical protein
MAMTQGSVAVADDGTVTKSGAAGAVYDALIADLEATKFPALGEDGNTTLKAVTIPDGAKGAPIKRGLARQANAIASLIPYILANANITAEVAVQQSGIAYLPNNIQPGVACTGPILSPVVLQGYIA